MPYVLYVPADALGTSINAWVLECDVDARDGLGMVQFTAIKDEAKRFPNFIEAMDYWKLPSTVQPVRDDGKPNRPLTAFTVEPQPVPRCF